MNSPLGGEEGPSGIKTTLCPVCEEVIHGNGDELNSHVETCLRKVQVYSVYDIKLGLTDLFCYLCSLQTVTI